MIMTRTYAAIVAALLPVLALAQDTPVLNGRLQSPLWGDGWAVTGVAVYASNVYAGAIGTTNAITRNGLVDISALLGGGGGGSNLTNATWVTNTITIGAANTATATAILGNNYARRLRTYLTTTNQWGPVHAFVDIYDGTNVPNRKVMRTPYMELSTGLSPSNTIAGATNIYLNNLTAPNGALVRIEDAAGGSVEYGEIASLSSYVKVAWASSYDGAQEQVAPLAAYRGKLYYGQGSGTGDGDVFQFDGTAVTTNYNGAQETISCGTVYRGNLYVGQGDGTGDGDVLMYDGTSWTTNYDGAQERIFSLCVYQDKLYAGQGDGAGDGDVLVYDGTSWTTSFDGAANRIQTLIVYRNRLFAAVYNSTGSLGDVWVFDGTSWTRTYDTAYVYMALSGVFHDLLFSGSGAAAGLGDIFTFDGSTWGMLYDGTYSLILSGVGYNNRAYIGTGQGSGEGDVLNYDGNTVAVSYNGAQEVINNPTAFRGRLYAGQGFGTGDGDVLTLETEEYLTLAAPMTYDHTNPVVSVVQSIPVTLMATSITYRVTVDDIGAQTNTTLRLEMEVLQ